MNTEPEPTMLEIKNLHARLADGREILKGIDLAVKPGEVHAIMGPNGSGKSTLAGVLAGRPGYEITEGSVTYLGRDLLALSADERAREGVFLAFQYPVEIPGVNNMYFLRAALNAGRRHRGEAELDAGQFLKAVRAKLKLLDIGEDLLQRAVNVGFSGGEKKRNEIFQMAMLEPKLAILDETDSGLDIDALRVVANGVNRMRGPDRAAVMITHYQRLLDYVVPDIVHVLSHGRIVRSGDKSLAAELECRGYAFLDDAAADGCRATSPPISTPSGRTRATPNGSQRGAAARSSASVRSACQRGARRAGGSPICGSWSRPAFRLQTPCAPPLPRRLPRISSMAATRASSWSTAALGSSVPARRSPRRSGFC
jgi:Fe-S cluster assembly ATP-binding protein